jgi:hypothetical protein
MHKIVIARVIYTDNFMKGYIKYRHPASVDIVLFSDLMIQDISKQLCYLNRPYLKIKGNMFCKTLRILAVYDEDSSSLIPLLITDKNDKIYGDNMIWNPTIKTSAELLYTKALDNISDKAYTIVQI